MDNPTVEQQEKWLVGPSSSTTVRPAHLITNNARSSEVQLGRPRGVRAVAGERAAELATGNMHGRYDLGHLHGVKNTAVGPITDNMRGHAEINLSHDVEKTAAKDTVAESTAGNMCGRDELAHGVKVVSGERTAVEPTISNMHDRDKYNHLYDVKGITAKNTAVDPYTDNMRGCDELDRPDNIKHIAIEGSVAEIPSVAQYNSSVKSAGSDSSCSTLTIPASFFALRNSFKSNSNSAPLSIQQAGVVGAQNTGSRENYSILADDLVHPSSSWANDYLSKDGGTPSLSSVSIAGGHEHVGPVDTNPKDIIVEAGYHHYQGLFDSVDQSDPKQLLADLERSKPTDSTFNNHDDISDDELLAELRQNFSTPGNEPIASSAASHSKQVTSVDKNETSTEQKVINLFNQAERAGCNVKRVMAITDYIWGEGPGTLDADLREAARKEEEKKAIERLVKKTDEDAEYFLELERQALAEEEEKLRRNRVIVTNIAADAEVNDLVRLFRNFKLEIDGIRLLDERHPLHRTRTAYMDFSSRKAAALASLTFGYIYGLKVEACLAIE